MNLFCIYFTLSVLVKEKKNIKEVILQTWNSLEIQLVFGTSTQTSDTFGFVTRGMFDQTGSKPFLK